MGYKVSNNISEFEQLLEKFSEEVFKLREPTLLELSGYHQYENGISNILAFYLDPDKPHDFSLSFVSGFLNLNGIKDEDSEVITPDQILREVQTEKGKYLDLLIQTPRYIIAIENKINAKLDNPLSEYISYVKSKAKGREEIYLLLTKKRPKYRKDQLSNFKHVYYEDLFKAIDDQIKKLKDYPQGKYYTYYQELQKIIMGRELPEDVHQFIINNTKKLQQLKSQVLDQFDDAIERKLRTLVEVLGDEHFTSQVEIKKDKLEGVVFFDPKRSIQWNGEELNFKLKVRIRPEQWFVEAWDHNTDKTFRLIPILDTLDIEYEENKLYGSNHHTMESSVICWKYDFQDSPIEVADLITKNFITPLLAYINQRSKLSQ